MAGAFCNNWCWYYLEQKDTISADPYYQVLDMIAGPEELSLQKLTIFRVVSERLEKIERGGT